MTRPYQSAQAALQPVDPDSEVANVDPQVASDFGDRPVGELRVLDQLFQAVVPAQRAGWNLQLRIEFVEEPADL